MREGQPGLQDEERAATGGFPLKVSRGKGDGQAGIVVGRRLGDHLPREKESGRQSSTRSLARDRPLFPERACTAEGRT